MQQGARRIELRKPSKTRATDFFAAKDFSRLGGIFLGFCIGYKQAGSVRPLSAWILNGAYSPGWVIADAEKGFANAPGALISVNVPSKPPDAGMRPEIRHMNTVTAGTHRDPEIMGIRH